MPPCRRKRKLELAGKHRGEQTARQRQRRKINKKDGKKEKQKVKNEERTGKKQGKIRRKRKGMETQKLPKRESVTLTVKNRLLALAVSTAMRCLTSCLTTSSCASTRTCLAFKSTTALGAPDVLGAVEGSRGSIGGLQAVNPDLRGLTGSTAAARSISTKPWPVSTSLSSSPPDTGRSAAAGKTSSSSTSLQAPPQSA